MGVVTFEWCGVDMSAPAGSDIAGQMRRGVYVEQADINWFLSHVPKDGLLIDVGANIGMWTIPLAQHSRWVNAFEPSSRERLLLNKNLHAAGLRSRVAVYPHAVASFTGRATLHVTADRWNGQNSLAVPLHGVDVDHDELVGVTTLDRLPWSMPVAGMKIDAEGEERAVLDGAADLIDRDRPTLVIEANNIRDITNFLTVYGYTMIRGSELNVWCLP